MLILFFFLRLPRPTDSTLTDTPCPYTKLFRSAIYRLEGDYMQHYPDDDSYEITKARAIGQQPGSPITIGTSNTAIMDQGGERIVMKGNAHVHRLPDQDNSALDVKSQQLTIMPDQDEIGRAHV